MRDVIEKYTVIADMVPAQIIIIREKGRSIPLYEVNIPKLAPATEAMLPDFIEKLADKVPAEPEGFSDAKRVAEIRVQFFEDAREYLKTVFSHLGKKDLDVLAGILVHRMYGLDILEVLMADNNLEELAVNGAKQQVAVFHKKYGWCVTSIKLETDDDIYNFASQIGRKAGREINALNPIMDAHMPTGDRVSATLFPISTAGNTITIRRFSRNPWTPISLIKNQAMNSNMAAFLWQAIQYEFNIIVAGGTASGKTSALNALCSFIPSFQRVISIEDTREINLPEQLEWNWVPLSSRNKNPEGLGEVTMLDLTVASLRMRPDRIVVGEIRRREQAETLFEAMHTGHSVLATMHADTTEQLKRRLLEPPFDIPKTEIEALQLILIQYRDRRKGVRRTLEMAEVLSGTKDELQVHYLYRYRARNDSFEKVYESIRVREDLNLHTGMTDEEMREDHAEKQRILDWLVKHDITDINKFGAVMHLYYRDRPRLLKAFAADDIKAATE